MARYVNADEWVIIPVVKKMDDEPSELPITIADLIKRTTKKEPIYADVREVKHCHIVHDKGGWLSCSNCHILLPQLFDVYRYYYCPNCGAIMDEGE